MATPRSQLIDPEVPLHYHLISRCVRRSWLCGRDRSSGKNYNHRKTWFKERLLYLARYFAIEVDAYTIMDNHFHLVIFYDPKECFRWNDTEVARRWCEAFPTKAARDGSVEAAFRKSLQQDELRTEDTHQPKHSADSWYNRVASFRKRQRAYGLLEELRDWGTRQGWQRFSVPIVGSSVS